MYKRIVHFLLIIFIYVIRLNNLNGQTRYIDNLPGNTIKETRTYCTMPLSKCWRKGNKPAPNELIRGDNPILYNPSDNPLMVPGSNPNNKCFNFHEYYSLKPNYDQNDTTVDLNMTIYKLADDTAKNRKAIIYIAGGQGTFDHPMVGSGLRYWGKVSFDQQIVDYNRQEDEEVCQYFARKGYLVVVIDVRKGWDIKPVNGLLDGIGIPNYKFNKYCACEDSCDAYSYLEAYYRILQDMRAAHGKLVELKDILDVDPMGISYMGKSTGGLMAMIGSFGEDDFQDVLVPGNNNPHGALITMKEKFGSPDIYLPDGITPSQIKIDRLWVPSGAIVDTNWIELSDSSIFVNNKKFPVCIFSSSEDEVFNYCSGYTRDAKYYGESDENLFVYGGGAIHDRIINLGAESHLVTYHNLNHGGLYYYDNINCYNFNYENDCFANHSDSARNYKVLDFEYGISLPEDPEYIHALFIASTHKDTTVNGHDCNFCNYYILADKHSNISQRFSCCFSSCDPNIITGIPRPGSYTFNNLLFSVYPTITNRVVNFKKMEKTDESFGLSIFDVCGVFQHTEYLKKESEVTPVNVSGLMPGVYLYQLKGDKNSLQTGKFIIK